MIYPTMTYDVVCYTAVFSVVTQRSSPLRDDTKNGCVADYLRWRYHLFLDTGHFVHAYRLTSLAMYGTMVPLAYVATGV